jgi:hypothetical protein
LPNLLASIFVLFVLSSPVNAAVFCVDSASALQSALTATQSNGVDDEIRIVQGTYVGNFVYGSSEANTLSVLGGYTVGCANRALDPVNTVLDGNRTGTVFMHIARSAVVADLLVEGLTLRNGWRQGDAAFGYAGGLRSSITGGAVTLNRNIIEDNFASEGGGGAHIWVGDHCAVTVTNNTIRGNNASRHGGGVYILTGTDSQVTIVNNSILANSSIIGGGLDIYNDARSVLTMIGNSVQGNAATYIAGVKIYSRPGTATALINNTITENSANGATGVELTQENSEDSTTAVLYNNLFWNNIATEGSGGDLAIRNNSNGGRVPPRAALSHNNFNQSVPGGFDIRLPFPIDASNLNAVDPLFVDPENGDLSLLSGSPMIDAGDPDTPNLPSTDLAGQPRVIGGVVDIGAYEFDDGVIPSALLNSAVLPYARAVAIGETATAFASVINSGNATAIDCSIALPGGLPASFSYQTTNAANALIGNPDSPVDIAPGATQGFVFGITPSQAMAATEIPLVFDCANTSPAPSHAGLNTFILSAATTAPPDLLAIGATASGDGVVRLPNRNGTGFFATAAVNIGSAGAVTVSADDGGRGLPLNLQVCETTPAGEWIVCGNTLTRSIGADRMAYYSVFATGTGQPITFDPANNRLFLRFASNGTTVGATNVAVTAP